MDAVKSMSTKDLMKACMPLLVHPSYEFFQELMIRKQAQHIKAVCSLNDPVDIYRAQGQVKAYDAVLNLHTEIKAVK